MNLETVSLKLPVGASVKGALYNTYDLDYLSEDLLEIDLPSGLTIDVGWYPEGERPGTFQVVIFKQFWQNQILPPIKTESLPELVRIIEMLAEEFSKTVILYSDSTENTKTVLLQKSSSEFELAAA